MRDRDDDPRRDNDGDRDRERDNDRAERRVEDKYLSRLADPRDDFAAKRIDDQASRLAASVGHTPAEIKEAWHLWRAKDPQPETHANMDAMQVRLSDDKNLAFASLLARARDHRPSKDERESPRVAEDDDNPFAAAARGAGFRPAGGNWGERPNLEPPPDRLADVRRDLAPPQPHQDAPQLMREAISPLERQVVQAVALEAVARGALDVARNRELERPESRQDYYARKRADLDDAQVKTVERDVEKLKGVPGLGNVDVAEREFEKADGRFRGATTEDERAKAFTRAAALSILVDELRRRREAPPRPLPVNTLEQPIRSDEREPAVVVPIHLGEARVTPGQEPTTPGRKVLPLDLANSPTVRRVSDDPDGRQVTSDPMRDVERTDLDARATPDREEPTTPEGVRAQAAREPSQPSGGRDGTPTPVVERDVTPTPIVEREDLLPRERTVAFDDAQLLEERSVSFSRSVERDVFALRDRDRANSEVMRLAEAVVTEVRRAQVYRDVEHIAEPVREAAENLRSDPENADWLVVARKHEALQDEADRADDYELHLPERIALAELAMDRYGAHHRLVSSITEANIQELRAAPPWERDTLKQEALLLLEVESRRGDHPFQDNRFVGRELVRVSDADDDSVRVLSLINAYNRGPEPSSLAAEARWEPDTVDRVRQQGDALLQEDPVAVEARLTRELTRLRMAVVLDPDDAIRSASRQRAKELAMLIEDLPIRRSLELKTR